MIIEVLYNADCPICAREIAGYRRYTDARGLPVRYAGLDTADLAAWELTPEQAARRLHVRKEGAILAGVPAFVALWAAMPRFRWLAALVALPLVRPVAEIVYERVLAPLLYRMHRRRVARGECSVPEGRDGPAASG